MKKSLNYAGRLERFFAYLIDQFGVLVIAMVGVALFIALGIVKLGGTPETPIIDQSSFFVVFLCLTAYHVISTGSGWQATPGQRLMNIHVVRTNGQKLGQLFALERFLAYILPSLPMYASSLPAGVAPLVVAWLSVVWFGPILTSPQRTGLHDKLCRTRVVVGRVGT